MVLALNYGEINQNKSNLLKGTCNKCGKYFHRSSNFRGNKTGETQIIINRNTISTDNDILVEERATGQFIVGHKIKRKKMM